MTKFLAAAIFTIPLVSMLYGDTINVTVAAGGDDAEEVLSDSTMSISDDELDIVYASSGLLGLFNAKQKVATRFQNIKIPQGTTIDSAYIQFRSSGNDNQNANIVIVGENSDNSAEIGSASGDLTGRPETLSSVAWSPVSWSKGNDYQTADIKNIVQEIIDRDGWHFGNALTVMFKAGSGCTDKQCRRRAESYDYGSANAPQLHIEYTLPPLPPIMGEIPDSTAYTGVAFHLDISAYVTPTNGDPVTEYALSGTLPAGLSFDSVTGVISGMVTSPDVQVLSVTATDKDGASDPVSFTITSVYDLAVNFRMDECYWLGGANGVTGDVLDHSGNGLHATSRNRADNTQSNFQICRAGDFDNTYADETLSDAVYFPDSTVDELAIGNSQPFSVSAWVYRHSDDKWMAAVVKVSDDSWTDGWGLEHSNGSGSNIDFFVGDYTTYARAPLNSDTWTHVVATYDGADIRIYTDGVLQDTTPQTGYSAGALAVSIGDDISGSLNDDRWQGSLDEVKIWRRALSASEIQTVYANENSGLNYDGQPRTCQSCTGVDIEANSWQFIGVPANGEETLLSLDGLVDTVVDLVGTVGELLGDDMPGALNTDWVIYKRTYSTTDNSSSYQKLSLTDPIEFGQGYWLGSTVAGRWDVEGLTAVSYDSGHPACTAAACAEIDLTPVTLDFSVDANDGSGPYRYNMSGFIGLESPVDWADCRFLIDGTAYTPSEANASGFASKQIWLYDPSNGGANSNGYTTCADDSPGGCKLAPFKGFWVELHGPTKNKTVKLLIPQE